MFLPINIQFITVLFGKMAYVIRRAYILKHGIIYNYTKDIYLVTFNCSSSSPSQGIQIRSSITNNSYIYIMKMWTAWFSNEAIASFCVVVELTIELSIWLCIIVSLVQCFLLCCFVPQRAVWP